MDNKKIAGELVKVAKQLLAFDFSGLQSDLKALPYIKSAELYEQKENSVEVYAAPNDSYTGHSETAKKEIVALIKKHLGKDAVMKIKKEPKQVYTTQVSWEGYFSIDVLFGTPMPDVKNNRFVDMLKSGKIEFLKGQWHYSKQDYFGDEYEATDGDKKYTLMVGTKTYEHSLGTTRDPARTKWELKVGIRDDAHRIGEVVKIVVIGSDTEHKARRMKAVSSVKNWLMRVFGIDLKYHLG